MPQPYLRHVSSRPTKVAEQTWTRWYLDEHIRDTIYHKVARTAAFYKATGKSFTYLEQADREVDQMDHLAIYQTDRPRPQDQQAFKDHVRVRSTLLGEDNPHITEVADLVMEDLELVEILGSYEFNEGNYSRLRGYLRNNS